MDDLLDFAPIIAVTLGLLGLLGLLRWWAWRGERKEGRKHVEALSALVGGLGGRVVVGRVESRAWSAHLLPPMTADTEGFFAWLGVVRWPRFEIAVDFRRGEWPVRVSEASMKKTNGTPSYEHRIEVATSPLPATRICKRVYPESRRTWLFKNVQVVGPAGEPPLTAERDQQQWLRVVLPEALDREFTVFSTDPVTVRRMFTPQVVEWMLDRTGSPGTSAMPFALTFEAGFAYTVEHGRIAPDRLLPQVDAILGLLDRMRAAPAHPPAPV
ncbi:hypothetical protein [Saccharothrix coeruleofusca]|uniref:DUF3137 domain-containing protein n=1 Tax=Saccharothrix coeruleofusca TaxID=33919 RepID=A0A918APX9_9PSEU|nr:hypothetical protein [Saccharothrix coeruleofusca]GGP68460.1 hypothetical protein GCM10010185_46630 [Saccharothrix coeruleofusca]